MMRASVLALLLVLAPLARAEEGENDADFVPSTEVTEVEPEEAAVPDVAVEENPSVATEKAPFVPPSAPPTAAPAVEKSVVEAPAVPSPAESSSASHKVVRGDTLWDLAGAYLNDPFLWPKIFDANRDRIDDPRLIFPNQEFVIPTMAAAEKMDSAAGAAASPMEEASVAPISNASAESVSEIAGPSENVDGEAGGADSENMSSSSEEMAEETPEDLDEKMMDEREAKKKKTQAVPGAGFMGGMADSFLADENWEYDGYVLRDRDQRMMISQGDVVFLNIGAASGVKPKMEAHVYRVGKKVKDPYLKKKTGRMVKRVGSVMVTGQVTDEGCTAVVTNSLEPIRIGDIVKFIAR